jgi:hypothetical protein
MILTPGKSKAAAFAIQRRLPYSGIKTVIMPALVEKWVFWFRNRKDTNKGL